MTVVSNSSQLKIAGITSSASSCFAASVSLLRALRALGVYSYPAYSAGDPKFVHLPYEMVLG